MTNTETSYNVAASIWRYITRLKCIHTCSQYIKSVFCLFKGLIICTELFLSSVLPCRHRRKHSRSTFMFTYVHGHTTDTWPAVPLGLVLVVGATSLQDGLVNTTTSGNDTCNTEGRAGQKVHRLYYYTAPSLQTAPKVGHGSNEETSALPDIKRPYRQQLCWQRR